MADPIVNANTRPWSEEVAIADPTPEDKTVYEFASGKRKFEEGLGPYAPHP